MADVKYGYAYDEHGRLVSIKQASLERDAGHSYCCIGCGSSMITRLGKVRIWHFAHRNNEVHCGAETYLHKLSKLLLREKFEKEGPFEIGYYRDVKCSDMETCPFMKEGECISVKPISINLKDYYDKCLEEQAVNGYIADLLFSSSLMPDRAPVLFEIHVSHKCTAEKIDSGLRIVEIRIKTEEDILSLLSKPILESKDSYGHRRENDIKFYGFKSSPLFEHLAKRSIKRFYLFPSGKAYVNDDIKTCRDANKKENSRAFFEASIDPPFFGSHSLYEYGYAAARQNGVDVKTCLFCKYYKGGVFSSHICCLYKKYGTPKVPKQQYAKQCEYYSEDRRLLNDIMNSMPPIVIASTQSDTSNT